MGFSGVITMKLFSVEKKYLLLIGLLVISSIIGSVESCGPGRGGINARRSRKLVPLVFKQHIPNVSENSLSASGLEEGKITRNDTSFRSLTLNYNADIEFRDDEGTGADRVMTQRCKEKLNTLALSVMNQWPGINIRVTEGWDEDATHGSNSLHYEGRAVDIQTSDRDRTKYGMLARLAVEAGFDWVHYEGKAHIHCSVKPDSSQLFHTTGCFTGTSTVLTSTGETRQLNELKIGEEVLAMDDAGNKVYSEVILFMHRDDNQIRDFVKIVTASGEILRTTPSHLVIVWRPETSTLSYMFAYEIEHGDFVLVNDKFSNRIEPRKVTLVTAERLTGVYAPLTKHGTIIVNSITASCYALVNSQKIAHTSFLPIRIANAINNLFSKTITESRQIGIHWYAQFLYTLGEHLLPSDLLYEGLIEKPSNTLDET